MQFAFRIVGWGVVIYALMYLLWSGLVIYGQAGGALSLVVRIAALAFITMMAARSLHLRTAHDIFPYAVSWAAISILLDAIFLVPFSGWSLYASWSVWVGYALVIVFPLITTFRLRTSRVSGNE